jgi:hypothetical protein
MHVVNATVIRCVNEGLKIFGDARTWACPPEATVIETRAIHLLLGTGNSRKNNLRWRSAEESRGEPDAVPGRGIQHTVRSLTVRPSSRSD